MLHVLQITMSTGIFKQILQGLINSFSNYYFRGDKSEIKSIILCIVVVPAVPMMLLKGGVLNKGVRNRY